MIANAVTIAVFNRQKKVRVDLRWLRKLAQLALPETVPHSASSDSALAQLDRVEIVLVSDATIAAIHEQFMQISGATDVITFEHGEIVISSETAQQNAARFSQSIEHELALYLIHGLLHLNGHDDQRPADAARMKRLQTRILQNCLKALG